jgi:peroxiredoxin Q/BCP
MIAPGQPFPPFSLPNQNEKTVSLSDFAGRWLVVYVYPKDDTPGCTAQGKGFTAAKEEFDRANIAVVGLNQDAVDSHKDFCEKFQFTIDLLSDTTAELLRRIGVSQSEWYGAVYWDRTTFVVDPDGIVRKVYTNVKPEGHERVLLRDITAMQAAAATGP